MAIEVVLDSAAVRDLLFSAGVAADLDRRSKAVAKAAGPGNSPVIQRGKDRLRAAVWTATYQARAAEANNHALLKALDAAR